MEETEMEGGGGVEEEEEEGDGELSSERQKLRVE